jgi:hypothetical protein
LVFRQTAVGGHAKTTEIVMDLFEQDQKFKEINFDKIENQLSEIVKPYYSTQHCDLIVLINSLVELEKAIIDKRGKNKSRIENNILNSVRMFYDDMIVDFEFDYENLDEALIANTKNQELKQVHLTSLKIFNLIELILKFKMQKDNFSSKRKGHAIGLLCSLLTEYHIKGEFDIFRNVLNSGKDVLIIRTLDELDSFIKQTEEELPKDLIQTLYQSIKKTKNRYVAVGCLNVLISIGKESEGSALMIIDDWKEKNYDYR